MIAIKTNKHVKFPPSYEGFIRMEIDFYINYPNMDYYNLRIIDSCFILENVTVTKENGETEVKSVEKILYKNPARFYPVTYDKLRQLTYILNVDMSDKTKQVDDINELFRQGLLVITQMECNDPVEKGRYYTKAEDWEIDRT